MVLQQQKIDVNKFLRLNKSMLFYLDSMPLS